MTTNSPAFVLPSYYTGPADTNDLRDIRAPVEIPVDLTWLWWTLGALVLVAVLFWIARKWKQATLPVVAVPIPAHLRARQNWYQLFNEAIEGFDLDRLADRQRTAFAATGVPLPAA